MQCRRYDQNDNQECLGDNLRLDEGTVTLTYVEWTQPKETERFARKEDIRGIWPLRLYTLEPL